MAMKSKRIKFYGLLYISEQDIFYNLKDRGSEAVDRFAEMACLCAKSAAHFGIDFALVTNKRDDILSRYDRLGLSAPEVIEETFSYNLPSTLSYLSAHHKLELINKFASGHYGENPCLIDIDTVFIKPFPVDVLAGKNLVIDMSYKMINRYNGHHLGLELARLADYEFHNSRWFGGEFISGPHDF